MSKTLDALIQRRQVRKAEKRFLEEGSRRGPGNFTASQTGASQVARLRNRMRPGIGEMAARSEKSPQPKGATPQFRETTATDIEDMISGKKKKGEIGRAHV